MFVCMAGLREGSEMSTTEDVSPERAAIPVIEQDRILSIDVLRGFALFGVLLMNMQAFADIFAVYMHPFARGEISALSFACWCTNHILADAKFITIFSMLFGAGIVLMTGRAKERTGRSASVHYRRMFWMGLFGVSHALLLWYGDILFMYAICGMAAYLFRRFWPWVLFLVAGVSICVTALIMANMHKMPPEDMLSLAEMWAPTAEYIETADTTMRGGWLGQVSRRFDEWLGMFGFLLIFGWRLLGCMLLGMALYKKGVFSAARSAGFYVTLAVIGLGAGLSLSAYGVVQTVAHDWDMLWSMGEGSLFNYFGSLLAAFGYIGVVMLVCRAGSLPWLRHRLGAVGRMAFTNYIMHSVILTTVFNGHGLGLFGQVDRIWQQLLVLAVFGLQLWYSPLWLTRYRFGPLEWLWRALTYWRLPAFRRPELSG